jgi:hypothetical protein
MRAPPWPPPTRRPLQATGHSNGANAVRGVGGSTEATPTFLRASTLVEAAHRA